MIENDTLCEPREKKRSESRTVYGLLEQDTMYLLTANKTKQKTSTHTHTHTNTLPPSSTKQARGTLHNDLLVVRGECERRDTRRGNWHKYPCRVPSQHRRWRWHDANDLRSVALRDGRL